MPFCTALYMQLPPYELNRTAAAVSKIAGLEKSAALKLEVIQDFMCLTLHSLPMRMPDFVLTSLLLLILSYSEVWHARQAVHQGGE